MLMVLLMCTHFLWFGGRDRESISARGRHGHKAATTMLEATLATKGLHYSVTTLDGPK